MKVILQIFQRLMRGSKPSPNVKPEKIISHKKSDAAPKQRQQPTEKQGKRDNFWQDKIESDGNEAKQKFYLKHRDRLQNQDQQQGHER